MTQPTDIDCPDRLGRRPRYLRISITGRCNLRCLYCTSDEDHSGSPPADGLTDTEIRRLLPLFARLGVCKVRFTGGEPLLRPGLPDLMRDALATDGIDTVALTTNGWHLESQLDAATDAGLRSVNISCDTLRRDRFYRIARRRGLGRVLRAIDAALAHPQIKRLKLNVVVMRGINDDEVGDFLAYCENPKVHVRFIEFMPTADVAYARDWLVPETEIRARLGFPLEPIDRDDPTAPAKLWALTDRPGRVGFISTMTHKFCDACTRIRLTADGRIANCLFAETLLDLKTLLRTGADDATILTALTSCWQTKPAAHRLDDPTFRGRPTMIAVGG
ncbi:MAG TPA: GTP 3',8-cyclase MoaA [Acidobacteriota bacterium]|nr:GTP 3',8-cyclase MoaA [Acidobacteriota bacterium]